MVHDVGPRAPLGRRNFLKLSGATATAVAWGINAPDAKATPARPAPDNVFGLGVASGDPRPDGVVLWTRLAPEPLAADGHGGMPPDPVPVQYQVAEDTLFRRVVRSGQALASPELAHAVHPEVTGLRPDREYFYRFRVGTQISPVGRTRTLPAPGQPVSSFSFASASCQAWYHGYFSPYRHMAEEDLDMVLFLGDYIYEYGIVAGDNLWRQGASVGSEHGVEIQTLEQYRLRYSLFKTDPHLQAVHAAAPWLITWDDHEVQNNYGADESQYGISPQDFLYRRAIAYRAFYENLPLSLSTLPQGPQARIHRRFDYGSLVRFNLIDERQYRGPVPANLDEQYAEQRSILGYEQEKWLYQGMTNSPATWNVVATGDVVTAVGDNNVDMWDGFPAARRRLTDVMQHTRNPVVLAGDVHKHVASELKADFSDPASTTVGVELICTSIASDGDGSQDTGSSAWVKHPYVRGYDARRGYLHVRMTPNELISDFKIVPWIEQDADAPIQTSFRFATPAGRPSLERLI
ncbi:alkaline phosphatase D family protein [Saccharopolyspora sp. K220]|uniref:alkaline phosphatase D family protein n=1 Tax=Saccharopolyspora soli TaxID=2926618 RepID=UPI001F55B8DE|nr:alkaline phosphatase D family protein [Saccharopolyspora soli]MCI2419321.1 alkaline phosphatase D family protein [Saccharopolyspora soli]